MPRPGGRGIIDRPWPAALRLDERSLRLPDGPGARRRRPGAWPAWPAGSGATSASIPTVVRLALVVLTFANGLGVALYLVGLGAAPRRRGRARRADPARGAPSAERAVGLGLLTVGTAAPLRAGRARSCRPAWCGRWRCRRSGSGSCGPAPTRRTAPAGCCCGRPAAGCCSWSASACCSRPAACSRPSAGSAWRCSPPASAWPSSSARGSCACGRDLGVERRERIRSEERSEIAAHLHDSVLQTLALIQRADAPGSGPHARPPPGARAAGVALRRAPARQRRAIGHLVGAALERVVTDVEDAPRRRGRPRAWWATARWSRASTRSWPPSARPPTTPPATPASPRCRSTSRWSRSAVTAYVRDRGKGFDARRRRAGPGRRARVDHRPHGPPRRPGRGPHRAGRGHRGRARGRPHARREDGLVTAPAGVPRRRPPDVPRRGAGRARATPSRSWARRPTSSRPCRASGPPTPRSCCSTCTSPAAAARPSSRRSSRSGPTSCSSPCRCPTPPRT